MKNESLIFSEAYVKYDVPSDTLCVDSTHLRKFKLLLPECYHTWPGKMISKKIISLRKRGRLPRIRDGHGPGIGSGGGHGKKKA